MGVRTIISTSFGEIFYNNCFKNGILPVVIATAELALLLADSAAGRSFAVDLIRCRIDCAGRPSILFAVDGWQRDLLLNGWDEVGMILARNGPAITDFETRQRLTQPWLWSAV
jgi:3-isopropylmalate/(R)-2-methylmalate dehydratase small subunit